MGAAEMSFVKGGFCMIRWKYTNPIDISYIRKTEELLGIRFPEDDVQCVLENNGGTPKPQEFDVEEEDFQPFLKIYWITTQTANRISSNFALIISTTCRMEFIPLQGTLWKLHLL